LPDFVFENFRKYIAEAEIASQEAEQSDMDKVLLRYPKLRYTLIKVLTSQKDPGPIADKEIKDIVTDIKAICYRPTTFKIVFKNSNYMDLKYDPTPSMVKNPQEYTPSDYFRVTVLGKDYDLGLNSDYEQALDQIAIAMSHNPIDTKNPDLQDQATENGEAPEEPQGPKPKEEPEPES